MSDRSQADEFETDNVTELPEPAAAAGQLTKRQRLVLETIIEWINRFGYPPAVRDISERAGLSSLSSVSYQLNAIEKLGYIKRGSNVARGIEVLKDPDGNLIENEAADEITQPSSTVAVPLLGEIAAGTGLLAVEDRSNAMVLPQELTGHGDLFMLKVVGDSMIDAGIFDGDFVVVRQQPTCENGDIVAALINGDEATVKTYKKRDGQVWLMPHNPAFEPIDGNNAQIMGVVKTVLRKL